MEQQRLMDVLVQAKRLGNALHEVMDVTRQLAEAIDRNDDVSIRMVMAMRQEPIAAAAQADDRLHTLAAEAPEDERGQLASLLNGDEDAVPQSDLERALSERMAANRKALSEVRAVDRILNQKLSRGRTSV